jgi:S1-C subfamily serine protease
MAAFFPLVFAALVLAGVVVQDAVRLVRAATGSGGVPVGDRYVLQEERSTFTRGRDLEVAASFEWEGLPGKHRLAATWRHIESGAISASRLEYEARDRRFGAFWTLPLSASTPMGRWRIEAAVDGQPAGALEFDVVEGDARPVPIRRTFTPAQLYERARPAFVVFERLNAAGGVTGTAAGFVADDGRIVTSFNVVDAADAVRAMLPDGRRLDLSALAGWNRQQGWAVVDGSYTNLEPLQRATNPPAVGDRCVSFEAGSEGARILLEGSIVGQHSTATTGARLLASFSTGFATRGSPVLNDSGEIIGLIEGGPGVGGRDMPRLVALQPPAVPGVPVIPIGLIPPESKAAVSLTELVRTGVLMRPLAGERNILSAGFAHKFKNQGAGNQPIDHRYEFTRADGTLVVFVTWQPQERLRGLLTLQIYDDENRVVGQSKAKNVNLRAGNTVLTDFTMSVPSEPGVYRADVLVDGRPAWRGFFRVVPIP